MRLKVLRSMRLGLLMLGGLSAASCGPYNNYGSVLLTWSLADARLDPVTAPPIPCENAGVTIIRVDLGSEGAFDFDCRANQGETGTVSAGNYPIQTIAFSGRTVLSALQFNQYVFGRTDLGHIIFQIPF